MNIHFSNIAQQVLDVVEMVVFVHIIVADISLWIVHKFYAICICIICCINDIVMKGITSDIKELWMYWSLYYFFHGTLLGRIDILGAKVVKIYEIGKKIENLCYF